jgi:hypothetical protein
MEDRVDPLARQSLEMITQICGRGKYFNAIGLAFAAEGRLLANQQRDFVAALGEESSQFRTEPAAGKIRQSPHIIERLIGRAGGDDAVHAGEIADLSLMFNLSTSGRTIGGSDLQRNANLR